MKSIRLLLILSTACLVSCSEFQVRRTNDQEMRCYSTWHPYPKNS